jgi:hypothetical protein
MSKKIACLFFNITLFNKSASDKKENFKDDTFFANNAINSFKTFHPDVDIHYVTDDNFKQYLEELNISEYYDDLALILLKFIEQLMLVKGYTKVIRLGIDTFTCSRLDEFIDNDDFDAMFSSGPPYQFLQTEYWVPLIETFEHNGQNYQDVSFINADVTCINNLKMASLLYEITIKYWTGHQDQGGMNYCYINQKELGIKAKIVDFPYIKTDVLYNVRSKGIACGGNQMYKGNLWNGNYKDPNSSIIGNVYPTFTYYIKDNKLYTSDHKQIKVFHYAEALGVKTKEEYNETLNEIKTTWFNKETIEFLTHQCNCKFN